MRVMSWQVGDPAAAAVLGQSLADEFPETLDAAIGAQLMISIAASLRASGAEGRGLPWIERALPIAEELEALIVRIAQEKRSWGYDRIVGALANLGLTVSAQTVGNVLKRHGITPAPERKTTTTWKEFIRTHMDVLVATDFFTAEVWTLGGLVTY